MTNYPLDREKTHFRKPMPSWDGFTGERKNILRIHGEKDLVIKCPKDAEIIKGAGHLVAMTHSDDCVRIIETTVNRP